MIVSHDIRLNPDIVRGADGKFITERKLVKSLSLEEIKQFDAGRLDNACGPKKLTSDQC